ncbi:MAG: hypothetical protein EF812_07610 [Methanosarcinales archaeon]|nr:MAG: hypothetical protein EF812_07610 [Methanosarcinales archaeon]
MQKSNKTRWHRLFAKLLEELLTPFGITVITEFPVMNDPPEADILILRKNQAEWSKQQLALLPDGIRESKAGHILIEFKYSESVNKKALSRHLVMVPSTKDLRICRQAVYEPLLSAPKLQINDF